MPCVFLSKYRPSLFSSDNSWSVLMHNFVNHKQPLNPLFSLNRISEWLINNSFSCWEAVEVKIKAIATAKPISNSRFLHTQAVLMFDRSFTHRTLLGLLCSYSANKQNCSWLYWESFLVICLTGCLIKTDLRDKWGRCCAQAAHAAVPQQDHTWWLFLLSSPGLWQDMGKGEWGNRLSAIALSVSILIFSLHTASPPTNCWLIQLLDHQYINFSFTESDFHPFQWSLLFGLSSSSQLHPPEFFLSCL